MLRHWSQLVPNMSTDIRGHATPEGRKPVWPRRLAVAGEASGPLTCRVRFPASALLSRQRLLFVGTAWGPAPQRL